MKRLFPILLCVFFLTGCTSKECVIQGFSMDASYQIKAQELSKEQEADVDPNTSGNGIWVGICGELGADLDMTETFMAIGVDELSVTPRAVLALRNKVRSLNIDAVREQILAEIEGDISPKF